MATPIIEAANDLPILLKKHDLPTLVDFWAPWCQPCKRLMPVLDDLRNRFSDKLQIIKVNVSHNKDASAHYQIKQIPTLLIFDRTKNLVKTLQGFHDLEEFTKVLEALPIWQSPQ